MASIALYKSNKVEITDVYESGGIQYASVKACEGEPFVGGNKWPVRTAYTIAQVDELEPVNDDQPQTQPNNLLALALQYAPKGQWYSGEIVYIFGNKKHGAYLRECGGFVKLMLTNYPPSCLIFWLSFDGWQISGNVKESYNTWARKAAEVIK
jgi:hypothetical protein